MTEQEQRNIYTGIMGTVAFHLIILVVFLTAKIGEVKTKHQEVITIEFSEEEYKPIEEIIEESKPQQEEIEPLNGQELSNIASNVADQMNEEISTEKYIEDVMEELGMEDINPQYDNELPDDPTLYDGKKEKMEDVKTNFGTTRITYNVPPNRKATYIDRPIYRCQGGGTVVIGIEVDQMGAVLKAQVNSSSTSETCIIETALSSAKNFRFERNTQAANKVEGTITYIFVAQ